MIVSTTAIIKMQQKYLKNSLFPNYCLSLVLRLKFFKLLLVTQAIQTHHNNEALYPNSFRTPAHKQYSGSSYKSIPIDSIIPLKHKLNIIFPANVFASLTNKNNNITKDEIVIDIIENINTRCFTKSQVFIFLFFKFYKY